MRRHLSSLLDVLIQAASVSCYGFNEAWFVTSI